MMRSKSEQIIAKERIWYLDWLRAFACLAVVLIHCFTALLDNISISELGAVRSVAWTEINILFARWAVPVFLMITGALLLDPSKNVGYTRVRNYVARMAAVLLSFGTLFALMEIVFDTQSFSVIMIFQALFAVLQGDSWSHLWYLYDLIGIYLLLPMFRSFVSSCNRRSFEALLTVLFVCALILPTVNCAFGLSLETFVWFGFAVFYVLLGWYLREYEVPFMLLVVLGVVGIAGVAIAAGCIIVNNGFPRWLWEPASPLIALWAATIFVSAKRFMNRPVRSGGAVEALGSLSFAVYVLHPVIVNLLYKALGWGPAVLPPAMFELVTYAIVLAGSLVLAIAAKRLPFLGRCL